MDHLQEMEAKTRKDQRAKFHQKPELKQIERLVMLQ